MSDSCHSGTVARAFSNPKKIYDDGKLIGRRRFVSYRVIDPDAWKIEGGTRDLKGTRLFEEGGWLKGADGAARVPWPVLLMSGCQDDEYSYDAVIDGKPCGAFTHIALAALKTMPEGATFNDWFLAIRKKLPSRQYPQTPRMIGSYIKRPLLFS